MNKGGNLTHGKEAWGHLERIINRGRDRGRVFHDWLDLMLAALLALTDNMCRDNFLAKFKANEMDGAYNDRYMEIVGRYADDRAQGDRDIDHFKAAYAALMREVIETQHDVLGEIYQRRITFGEHGQYFTPAPIAHVMAEIVGGESGDVNDPSCGSGVMLIEASKVNADREFYGTDLDQRCAKMCTLNMIFFDLNAVIDWGDTLAGKTFLRWVVCKGGYVYEIEPKEEAKQEDAKPEPPPTPSIQGALPFAA